MPTNIRIAAFVFGSILLLIGLIGGDFKLLGSEVTRSITNPWVRSFCFLIGAFLMISVLTGKISETGKPTPIPSVPPTPTLPTPTQTTPVTPSDPVTPSENLEEKDDLTKDSSKNPKKSNIPEHTPPSSAIAKKTLTETIGWSVSITDKQISQGLGEPYTYECPSSGEKKKKVWGSGPYDGRSHICEAAVHAGKISYSEGGIVTLEVRGKHRGLTGSQRHGVTSKDISSGGTSFVVLDK